MAKSKKIKSIRWSQEENKLLKRLFPSGREKEIVEQTGRTLAAVRQRAYTIGIKTTRSWSANELKLLKKLYTKVKAREIAEQTGRTIGSLRERARQLGLQ